MQSVKSRPLKAILALSVIAAVSGPIPALPVFAQTTETIESPVTVQTRTVHFSVEGMSCASCAARVSRTVKTLDGVVAVDVSLAERQTRVQYIDGKISPESIAAAVRELGYRTGDLVAENSQ